MTNEQTGQRDDRALRQRNAAPVPLRTPLRLSQLFVRMFLPVPVVLALALSGARADNMDKDKGSSPSPVLLELFTSQGCSSCPAADALLPSFIARKDVIALSMPVDYWDYLGWRDTLGQHIFTTRQRSYARHLGDGMVYTPQIVVDGRIHMNGADRKSIQNAIAARKKARQGRKGVKLSVTGKGEMLVVTVGSRPVSKLAQSDGGGPALTEATLWMALFSKREKVLVGKGENGGRELIYHNIVREIMPIGHWSGEPMTIKLPKRQIMQRGADGCVVMLQKEDGGPIVAAAQMSSW